MILPSKRLATHITGKWSLISMRPLVNEQVIRLGKLSIAELADEPLLGLGVPNWHLFHLLVQHVLQKQI
jgi:hypothetical protein